MHRLVTGYSTKGGIISLFGKEDNGFLKFAIPKTAPTPMYMVVATLALSDSLAWQAALLSCIMALHILTMAAGCLQVRTV